MLKFTIKVNSVKIVLGSTRRHGRATAPVTAIRIDVEVKPYPVSTSLAVFGVET
jgi:hypothetical protein